MEFLTWHFSLILGATWVIITYTPLHAPYLDNLVFFQHFYACQWNKTHTHCKKMEFLPQPNFDTATTSTYSEIKRNLPHFVEYIILNIGAGLSTEDILKQWISVSSIHDTFLWRSSTIYNFQTKAAIVHQNHNT